MELEEQAHRDQVEFERQKLAHEKNRNNTSLHKGNKNLIFNVKCFYLSKK